jgi:hypothetical protein
LDFCVSCGQEAVRVAVLVDPKWPLTKPFVSELRAAALAIGQELIILDVSSDRGPPLQRSSNVGLAR